MAINYGLRQMCTLYACTVSTGGTCPSTALQRRCSCSLPEWQRHHNPRLVTASTYFGQSCLQVTSIAKQMVINYGFSDIGPWSLMDPNAQQGDMIMRMMARNSMSEALQVRLVSCSVLALLRC